MGAGLGEPIARAHGTFKDFVQRFAEENGVLFSADPNNTTNDLGFKLFRFGPLSVYLHDSVAFVRSGAEWIPSSLPALLERARES